MQPHRRSIIFMKNLFMYLGRGIAFIYRLNTLRLAMVVFRGVPSPTIMRRRFLGKTMVLDVSRSNAQQLLWLQGERFVEERRLLKLLVRPGMTVVDVGANIGYYALMFASCLSGDGKILCLEPEPANLVELTANVSENALEKIVTILPVAAGGVDGTTRFEPGLNAHASDNGSLEVRVRRLDSLELPGVDFIKIDVEGYEGLVLDGARELIRRHHPTVFLELHPQLLSSHTHGEIIQFLQKHYPHVSAFQIASGNGLKRALQRYGLADPLTCLNDIQELADGYEAGTMKQTSWIVAQARTCA
jgi:FkbM family methyltransferase